MVAYSYKRQFVNPIRVGLGQDPWTELNGKPLVEDLEIPIRPKRQTIRAFGKRRHARPGETLQLYHGMRTRQCVSIGVARCISFEGVLLKWSEWPSFVTFDVMEREPGTWRRVGKTRAVKDVEEFARDDGFASFADMRAFWLAEHGGQTFEGALIKWEPIT